MTPLEKAARAAKAADLEWTPAMGTWDEHIARAVLMAVREPDNETSWGLATASGTRNHLRAAQDFTAMIDHILRGGEAQPPNDGELG